MTQNPVVLGKDCQLNIVNVLLCFNSVLLSHYGFPVEDLLWQ